MSDNTSLTDSEFQKFSDQAYQLLGIRLSPQKKDLLNNRLRGRLKALNIDSFKEYYRYLQQHQAQETPEFISAVTTNETFFFRCEAHFNLLAQQVFPRLTKSRIRVWSAACSTGAEPYSLAISLIEKLPQFQQRQIEIIASDIDRDILKQAHEGIFANYALRLVSPERIKKYFIPLESGHYQIQSKLRKMIQIGQHNLLAPFPKEKMDLIFCRNVLIYFDQQSKEIVLNHLYHALNPGGFLFLGESEIIPHDLKMRSLSASVAQKE